VLYFLTQGSLLKQAERKVCPSTLNLMRIMPP